MRSSTWLFASVLERPAPCSPVAASRQRDRRPGAGARAFALVVLFVGAGGCAGGPLAPGPFGRDPAEAGKVAGAVGTYEPPVRAVIVRVRPGVSEQELAAVYGASVVESVPEISLQLMSVPLGQTEQRFLHALQRDERVEYAEPNFILQTAEGRQSTIAFSEWHRDWRDVTDQEALARIGAREAHDLAVGRGVRVAVLDTGADLHHPALQPRLLLPGIERGATFLAGHDRPQGVDTNGDGIVDGALGHGTHVAGIVLAVAPRASLLPVRVLDSDGVGFAFAIAHGLVAAAQRGVHVVNMSLGMPVHSRAVESAVTYARDHGIVVIAPTGNGGQERIEFPAALPPVVAVSGTDRFDRRAVFANWGAGTDFAAPAVGILSTYVNGAYASWSGTSMSAPFVAGTAALLYERLPLRDPGAANRIEAALRAGALSLVATDPMHAAGLGSGRISAASSLRSLMGNGGGGSDPQVDLQ